MQGRTTRPSVLGLGCCRFHRHLVKVDGETGSSPYMAIHQALKRKFGTSWKLLGEERFDDVVAFLHQRIDATILGKLNRGKGRPNYSAFENWRS